MLCVLFCGGAGLIFQRLDSTETNLLHEICLPLAAICGQLLMYEHQIHGLDGIRHWMSEPSIWIGRDESIWGHVSRACLTKGTWAHVTRSSTAARSISTQETGIPVRGCNVR